MKQEVHFKFATEILKRLGEELNPNPDQGILELVKNSYDADAINCVVEVDSSDGGRVQITDDGVGMNAEVIKNSWLLIGKSSKTIKKETKLGRKPAGNKGLGRLAALRMGRQVTLISRPEDEPTQEYRLVIDWDAFDTAQTVEEVELVIESRRRKNEQSYGTTIILENIKQQLAESEVKRLSRGIILLADPFSDSPTGFQPQLIAPEFRELEQLVNQRYFQDCEFHLIAEVDSDGWATAVVTDYRDQILYKAEHTDLRPKLSDQPYNCPAAAFDLWAFLLGGPRFTARHATIKDLKDWLNVFGGVHLYIRGLRVSPYGDPGNDWLDMNLLRSRHAEEVPSTNNSIGRILLDDDEEQLTQKTDRSGIVETVDFIELREFALDAIKWMAKRRLETREKRLQAQKKALSAQVGPAATAVVNMLAALPAEKQREAKSAFKNYENVRDKETEVLRKEILLYRLLGTAGIAAAVFAHESKDSSTLISRNIHLLQHRWKEYCEQELPEDVEEHFDLILEVAKTLKAFGGLTLNFINKKKRRLQRIEIHKVIEKTTKLFRPLTNEKDIKIFLSFAQGNPYLQSSEAAVESIIANLIANSIKAFNDSENQERIIKISTDLTLDSLELRVTDSGTGIRGINIKDIWLPGETSYEDGTGLGLTIVRDTVFDLGGAVGATAASELGGAEIFIELPVLGR